MSKYDAVVIGAGTGGLSASLSLANAGKKVLLLEKHNLPGGCSSSFVRGRFEFDASLHEFCSIGSPEEWGMTGKLMMEDYKLNINWLLVPELYRCIGTTRSVKSEVRILGTDSEQGVVLLMPTEMVKNGDQVF